MFLESVEVFHEDGDFINRYFMKVLVIYENERGTYRRTFPKVEMKFSETSFGIELYNNGKETITNVDFGFGPLRAYPVDDFPPFFEELVEEKVHDLTIEEIQKKLGYKIRIVSNKEDKE